MSVLQRWHHKVHDIPRAGIRQKRIANAELCSQVAIDLGVPQCRSLEADYRIRNAGGGRFELTGRVRASLVRTCVVTLDPLEEHIDEPLDCVFLPNHQMPSTQAGEEEALSVEDLEPIHQDTIEVGRIVYEVLAASIDPYPRAPNAIFDAPADPLPDDSPPKSPFAALSKFKSSKGGPA